MQSNPTQSNPTQSNPMQSNPTQSNPTQSNPTQSNKDYPGTEAARRPALQLAVNVTLQGLLLQADKSSVGAICPANCRLSDNTTSIIEKITPQDLAAMDEQAAASANRIARTTSIDNRKIIVIDNLFNPAEIHSFYETITKMPYHMDEKDFESDQYPIFSTEFDVNQIFERYVVAHRIALMVRHYFPDQAHQLQRAYVNLCRYGDMEYPHRDCSTRAKNITALYYGNTEWDITFGGETKFYDQAQGTSFGVLPKPGRVVLFRGSVLHMGSIPTRICKQARYSFALKFRSGRIHALI